MSEMSEKIKFMKLVKTTDPGEFFQDILIKKDKV